MPVVHVVASSMHMIITLAAKSTAKLAKGWKDAEIRADWSNKLTFF